MLDKLLGLPKTNPELNTTLVLVGAAINAIIWNCFYYFILSDETKASLAKLVDLYKGLSIPTIISGASAIATFAMFRIYRLHKIWGNDIIKWDTRYEKRHIFPKIIEKISDAQLRSDAKSKIDTAVLRGDKRMQAKFMQNLLYNFIGDSVDDKKVASLRERFYERASAVWISHSFDLLVILALILNILITFMLYRRFISGVGLTYCICLGVLLLSNIILRLKIYSDMSKISLKQIEYISENKEAELLDAARKYVGL